jgi:hypothetical protein
MTLVKRLDEEWTAQLTTAAYLVSLRYCATSRWLDLQLELWRALSATVAHGAIVFSREDFLAELAYVAYRVALSHGCRRSFVELELELYQSMRRTVDSTAGV